MQPIPATENNDNECPKRKVYTFTVREIISYDYEVVASSEKEAREILAEDNYTYCEYEFNTGDTDVTSIKVDGSHQWHKDFKPTKSYVVTQVLNEDLNMWVSEE